MLVPIEYGFAEEFKTVDLRLSDARVEIHVFSKDGKKYSTVDRSVPYKIKVISTTGVPHLTGYNQNYTIKSSSSKITLNGGNGASRVLLDTQSADVYKTVSTSFISPKGESPVSLCNTAVERKLTNSGSQERWRIMRDGFTVELPSAYTAKLKVKASIEYKKNIGIVFVRYKYKTVDYASNLTEPASALVLCLPSPLATRPPEPEAPPAPPQRTRVENPPGLQIKETNPKNNAVDCPTSLHFTARIKFNESGEYTYFFEDESGTTSPKKTLVVNGRGIKDFYWNRRGVSANAVGQSEDTLMLGAAANNTTAVTGWVRVNTVVTADAGGKGLFKSQKQKYEVKCKP